jgi:hypothetical protein
MARGTSDLAKSDKLHGASQFLRKGVGYTRIMNRFLRHRCRHMHFGYRILRESDSCTDSKHPTCSYYVLFVFLQQATWIIV